jgi:hypothetical protein
MSISSTRINMQTGIRTASTAIRPRGGRHSSSMSLCRYGYVSLMKQIAHKPSSVSFVQKYGVGAPMNHALYTMLLHL